MQLNDRHDLIIIDDPYIDRGSVAAGAYMGDRVHEALATPPGELRGMFDQAAALAATVQQEAAQQRQRLAWQRLAQSQQARRESPALTTKQARQRKNKRKQAAASRRANRPKG